MQTTVWNYAVHAQLLNGQYNQQQSENKQCHTAAATDAGDKWQSVLDVTDLQCISQLNS